MSVWDTLTSFKDTLQEQIQQVTHEVLSAQQEQDADIDTEHLQENGANGHSLPADTGAGAEELRLAHLQIDSLTQVLSEQKTEVSFASSECHPRCLIQGNS